MLAGAALVPITALRAAGPTVFSESQRRCLEAFVNRLVPHDEYGPGAVECGVVEYIDRSFSDPLIGGKETLLAGLEAVDAFSRQSHGAPLADLPPETQDTVLIAMENNSAAVFGLIRRLTLEGMFCDPSYGGNRNFAGWDLIRYPGPRLAASPDDQRVGIAIKPVRTSVNGAGRGH